MGLEAEYKLCRERARYLYGKKRIGELLEKIKFEYDFLIPSKGCERIRLRLLAPCNPMIIFLLHRSQEGLVIL